MRHESYYDAIGSNWRSTNVLHGFVAGAIGGLAGAWVMSQVQSVAAKLSEGGAPSQRTTPRRDRREESRYESREQEGSQDDPTVAVAQAVSQKVLHHPLRKEERETAGPAVHYAFGATMGGLYGALAEIAPPVTACDGTLFGTALWLGAAEVMLPTLGLSEPPTEQPLSKHGSSLGLHWVYGLMTEAVRRALRGTP